MGHLAATRSGLPPPPFLSMHSCSITCVASQLELLWLTEASEEHVLARVEEGVCVFSEMNWSTKGRRTAKKEKGRIVQLMTGGRVGRGEDREKLKKLAFTCDSDLKICCTVL